MSKEFVLKNLCPEDRIPVIDIFNYYIENSFSAYPETKVPYEFFDMFMNMTKGYPAVTLRNQEDEIIGFGFIRAYNPMPVFKRTAEISYFIKNEYTGNGLGQLLLEHLLTEAKNINIDCILASISSFNEHSIKFHLKNGFIECGRFLKVGRKKDTDFDVVWLQKAL